MIINHVLVRTTDINAMKHFWVDVIGLKVGVRPPFKAPGAWLYSDDKPVVHVVHDPYLEAHVGALEHVAFEGADYDSLITSLNEHNVQYAEQDVPLTGEHQVFVSGPDGLNVEILFPIGTSN